MKKDAGIIIKILVGLSSCIVWPSFYFPVYLKEQDKGQSRDR